MSGRSNPNRHGGAAVPVDPESPVVPLEALGRESLPVAGGKGANLGELVRAGFPVPPGFVVTTAAYARFVAANGLAGVIARADAALSAPGAAIRAAFEAAPIPGDLARDVLVAYATLGGGPVAVRSSATAEDLPTAAFAGQQETFLNVSGPDALLDAVRRCWASLWSDRAIAYRARLGLDPATVQLAVVVQRLVPAEFAGVLFTANPVTGARDEVVIDASPGLGEAVVAGLVTPDHYVLRRGRRGWRVAARTVGRREVVIRPRAGGGTEEVAPAGEAAPPALPARALRDLAGLGTAIAAHFGAPQDVEWAWADGRIAILQARPITALPEPPPQPNFVQRMEAGMVAELLPTRPYPLEETTWLAAVLTAAVLGPASRRCSASAAVSTSYSSRRTASRSGWPTGRRCTRPRRSWGRRCGCCAWPGATTRRAGRPTRCCRPSRPVCAPSTRGTCRPSPGPICSRRCATRWPHWVRSAVSGCAMHRG